MFSVALLLLSLVPAQTAGAWVARGDLSPIGQGPVVIDPPGTVYNDTIIVVGEGESALLTSLTVVGEAGSTPAVNIIVDGTLTVSGIIQCTHANLTFRGGGSLIMQGAVMNVEGDGRLSVYSAGEWLASNTSINTYGGYTWLENNGTLAGEGLVLRDQYDGTYFDNNGFARLEATSITASGAMGNFWIRNRGVLELHHCVLSANYGGTISIESLFGSMLINGSSLSASGWSHGKQSSIQILDSDSTWVGSALDGEGGSTAYANHGESGFTNCTIAHQGNWNNGGSMNLTGCVIDGLSNWANAGNLSMVSCNVSDVHNLSNQGNVTLVSSLLASSNTTANIANSGRMSLTGSSFECCAGMNLLNVGAIWADGWMLRTMCSGSSLLVSNKGNVTFTQPFVPGVDPQDLASITAAGRNFTQAAGAIRIANEGLIAQAGAPPNGGASTWQLIVAAAVAVAIVLALIFFVRRKRE